MKNQFKKLVLLAVVLLTTSPMSAYDFEVDNIYYNVVSISDLTASVAGGSGDTLRIPAGVTYMGRTFTVIGITRNAFSYNKLVSITIPNSVTTIEDYAFQDCKNLSSVDIPNSVTNIGDYAFQGCKSLSSATISNSLATIGNYAFQGCESLSSVDIPNSVTTIGDHAFQFCESLSSTTISNSVTTIGISTFYGCKSLSSVDIPNSVTTIGNNAFYGCKSLFSVNIPNNSVTTIGNNAFKDCTSLDSITIHSDTLKTTATSDYNSAFPSCVKYIHISNSVDSIGSYIFNFESSLKEVIIDDSKTTLNLGRGKNYRDGFWPEYYGFFQSNVLEKVYLGRNLSYVTGSNYRAPFEIGGSKIKEIHVGDYVTDIKGLYLSGHKALEKMTIGKGLTEIPDMSSNSNLTSLILNSEVPQKAAGFSNTQYMHVNVYVPKGTLTAYQSADVWKYFWNLQEMETTDISNTITNKQPAKELRYYDAAGRETNGVRKGMNIIKMSDGTTRKVIIK